MGVALCGRTKFGRAVISHVGSCRTPRPVVQRLRGRWAAPQAVAAELGGRDAQQVKPHFLYVQNQNLRKGPWTQEEDAALLKARD